MQCFVDIYQNTFKRFKATEAYTQLKKSKLLHQLLLLLLLHRSIFYSIIYIHNYNYIQTYYLPIYT
jgi:hypothetical protein